MFFSNFGRRDKKLVAKVAGGSCHLATFEKKAFYI